jgi:hypothetical protein
LESSNTVEAYGLVVLIREKYCNKLIPLDCVSHGHMLSNANNAMRPIVISTWEAYCGMG